MKKITKLAQRHGRVRSKVSGSATCPRLSVFRSNRQIFAQLIDDASNQTLAAVSASEAKNSKVKVTIPAEIEKFRKVTEAFIVGKMLGDKAVAKKISTVCFDRGGNRYTGRIMAVAEGARAAGLKF